MLADLKTERLTARLPVTPCTIDLRESMVQLAKDEGVSLAHLQRYAFEFFLSQHVRKKTDILNQPNKLIEAVR